VTIRGTTLRYMALVDCSVPEEMLTRRESGYDAPDAFGVDVAYFLGDTRVALYGKRIPKRNTFDTGETPCGFDTTGKTLTYPVEDHPGEFVSIIEARVDGVITNRGVHIMKKFGALAEMSTGSF
jgi:hypothetical protein